MAINLDFQVEISIVDIGQVVGRALHHFLRQVQVIVFNIADAFIQVLYHITILIVGIFARHLPLLPETSRAPARELSSIHNMLAAAVYVPGFGSMATIIPAQTAMGLQSLKSLKLFF